MESITLTRRIEAPPDAVREAIGDVESFMRAGGFDEVTREDGRMRIRQVLGLATIELEVELLDEPGSALAYEQREGIFEEMVTRYAVDPVDGGTDVTASTEFALGGIAGSVIDATLIKRQRKRELTAQFDYLESALDAARD